MDRRFQTPAMSDSDTESVSSGVSSIASTPIAEAYEEDDLLLDNEGRVKKTGSKNKAPKAKKTVKGNKKANAAKGPQTPSGTTAPKKRKSEVTKALAQYGKTKKREGTIPTRTIQKDGKEVTKKIKVRHLDDHFIFKIRTIKRLVKAITTQGVATNAVSILATRIAMMFTKICDEAERLAAFTGKKTVLAEHVRHAIDSLFPGLRKDTAFNKRFSTVIEDVTSNGIRLRFARIARLCKHRGEDSRFVEPVQTAAKNKKTSPTPANSPQVAESYIAKKHLFRWSNRDYKYPGNVKNAKGEIVFRPANGDINNSAIALVTEFLLRYTVATLERAILISGMNMKTSNEKPPRISVRHVMAALSME